ncbi:MAG TPA: hypothetical protein DEP18_07275 [Flavobacteriales bacterium]|nr:hypothetical protein [Flavobacteriales bacterium]
MIIPKETIFPIHAEIVILQLTGPFHSLNKTILLRKLLVKPVKPNAQFKGATVINSHTDIGHCCKTV